MKKSITISTLFIALLVINSCKKEETPTPTTPTPTDYKSYIAYIDGNKFQPIKSDVYIDTNRDGNVLVKQLIAEIGNKSIVLQFTGETPGTYTLAGGSSGYEVGTYNVGLDSNWICTGSSGGGNLIITKYDKTNNKVSGTFNFKAKMFGTSSIKKHYKW